MVEDLYPAFSIDLVTESRLLNSILRSIFDSIVARTILRQSINQAFHETLKLQICQESEYGLQTLDWPINDQLL